MEKGSSSIVPFLNVTITLPATAEIVAPSEMFPNDRQGHRLG